MQNKNRRTVGRVERERESYNLEDGITLIALIVTIVVMLILVAVSIDLIVDGKLFSSAEKAVNKTNKKVAQQQSRVDELMGKLNELDEIEDKEIEEDKGRKEDGGNEGEENLPEPTKIQPGTKVADNTEYTDENEDKAIIPGGFTVSGKGNEATIDGGLVIYLIDDKTEEEIAQIDWTNEETVEELQTTYDQFVWIPIAKENINDMYMCQSEDGTKSCRITVQEINGEEVAYCTTHSSTQMAGRLYTTSAGIIDNSSLTTQTYTANSDLREPDIVTECDDNTTCLGYLNGILGTSFVPTTDTTNNTGTANTDFKTYLQEEYNEIVKSVYKNEGFYVGRYETSGLAQSTTSSDYKAKVVKGTLPSGEVDWYHMYAEQIKYVDNNNLNEESIGSTMIQGAAYDQVMKFVHVEGKYDVTTYGNVGHSFSSKYNTGSQSTDQSKNIFDLEENVCAWTSEAYNTGYRVYRGGAYDDSSSASCRGFFYPDDSYTSIGSLSQLFVK